MEPFRSWCYYTIIHGGAELIVYWQQETIMPIFEQAPWRDGHGVYFDPPTDLYDAVVLWARSIFYENMSLQEFLDGVLAK